MNALQATRLMLVGSQKPTVFAPWSGEFGAMLTNWVRFIDGYRSRRKIVCCHPDETVLFPSASEFVHDITVDLPDVEKIHTEYSRYGDKLNGVVEALAKRFPAFLIQQPFNLFPVTNPFVKMRVPIKANTQFGITPDVVICARYRQYHQQNNWTGWQKVVDALVSSGFKVGLVGRKETSFALNGISSNAWDNPNVLGAAVEMLENCLCFATTDTSFAHLASMMGVPMELVNFPWAAQDVWNQRETIESTSFAPTVIKEMWEDPDAFAAAVLARAVDMKRVRLLKSQQTSAQIEIDSLIARR